MVYSTRRFVYVLPCVILFLCFSVVLVLRLPRLGKRELILVLFVRLFGLCLFRFVGPPPLPRPPPSSLDLGGAAVCDCGTPWTFLLPFCECGIPWTFRLPFFENKVIVKHFLWLKQIPKKSLPYFINSGNYYYYFFFFFFFFFFFVCLFVLEQ